MIYIYIYVIKLYIYNYRKTNTYHITIPYHSIPFPPSTTHYELSSGREPKDPPSSKASGFRASFEAMWIADRQLMPNKKHPKTYVTMISESTIGLYMSTTSRIQKLIYSVNHVTMKSKYMTSLIHS